MAEAVSAFLRGDNMWLIFAAASALFAGLTSIFAKCGIRQTDSTVATAIRTVVVLLFAWLMVFIKGSQGGIDSLSGKTWLFLFLSGMATGASWLCYYRALQDGLTGVVVAVDKLSIIVSVAFAYFVFGERLSAKAAAGLFLIVAGTLILALPVLGL